ncbi:MAG: DNRLRE domain-containing protein, partial [Myxococcota bacterium]|nr:DNRLRE domain-containing protein [Myxococcota bacterium]
VSDTQLALSWTLEGSGLTVEVERATMTTGPFVRIFTTATGAVSFQDSGLPPASVSWYRVRAVRFGQVSDYSAHAWGTTAQVAAPPMPGGLTGAQEISNQQGVVRLTWTDVAGEAGYELQHSTDNAQWGAVVTLPAESTAWIHQTPAGLATNYYRLRAVNPGGESAWAAFSIYAGPILLGSLCPQPTAVGVGARSETEVELEWTFSSLVQCSTVAVERAASVDGPFTEIARVEYPWWIFPSAPFDTGFYLDTGRAPGTESFYRLRSISISSSFSSSGYSATVSAQTPNLLGPPTGLSVNVVSSSVVEFAWVAPATDETGFAVELASAAGGPFAEVFRVPANTTLAHAQGFAPGSQQWVRVRTVKGSTVSAPSAAVAFTTAQVMVLRATADATVYKSTALNSAQNATAATGANAVGCFFNWSVDLDFQIYLFHHCAASLLRFDTSSLTGKTVLGATLTLWPGQLGTGPMGDAYYAVFAMAAAWNPTTVTYNNLPARQSTGGWAVAAPTSAAPSVFTVTDIAQKWAQGVWGQHGFYVQQYPITDRLPPNNRDFQEQTTLYCSVEQQCGSASYLPTLTVEYR